MVLGVSHRETPIYTERNPHIQRETHIHSCLHSCVDGTWCWHYIDTVMKHGVPVYVVMLHTHGVPVYVMILHRHGV